MMVQQMIESKFSEYGLGNTAQSLVICDKQPPVAVKKTALRDLQNDNRIMASKFPGGSPFLKDRGPISDSVKVSGIKRPTTEVPTSPPCHQPPSGNGGNGHLVYVRRKSESDLAKSGLCGNMDNRPQSQELSHEEQETPRQKIQMKGSKVPCFPAFAPIPTASLMTFSSGGPSVPLSLGKPVNRLSPSESKVPTVASTTSLSVNPHRISDQRYKERFLLLQTHLRNCDHSSQEEYIRMLRSLSSVGRSRHAFELEKRAIQLSLEEGFELSRMKSLNIMGKYAQKNNSSPSTLQVESEK